MPPYMGGDAKARQEHYGTLFGGGRVYHPWHGPGPRPRKGRVILWSPEANLHIVGRFSEPPQVTSERAGGWDTVQRLTGPPISTWMGPQALKASIKVLFDGWQADESVAKPVRRLRELSHIAPKLDRPPKVKVVGRMPFHRRWWVIDTLTLENQLFTSHGRPARALATIGLVEHVLPEIKTGRHHARHRDHARHYQWRRGDTLHHVAKRELGDPGKAGKIRRANPRIKRWSKVDPGERIKIPRG